MAFNKDKIAFDAPSYPIDKVVFTSTGSFTVTAGADVSISIPHSLQTACLSDCIWSIDNINFTDAGMQLPTSGFDIIVAFPGCDTTNAKMYAHNGDSVTRTIYYTVYLIWLD